MSEIDYQTALLLQHKFDKEREKQQERNNYDRQLAWELQNQFQRELEVDRPSNQLVYTPTQQNSTKCLVDPSWEVIDPTPDVHVLFITFNQRFFWNSLGSVTVSWSKQMTSCAGVCSYQGRGGLCSIKLSEPLLKLRPRKDLIETLLHEMIHAYLFVTDNNRDRDGHGPEFHTHMYRINRETGTNISVYHNFHDEVKLYQQHWWRCSGPCQQWKPYFGIVRRTINRAPGPNDRWWSDHQRKCGGSFVKVKSPEPITKNTKKAAKPKGNNGDIRKFMTPTGKSTQSNVQSLSNPSGGGKTGSVIQSNIVGFTNLATTTSKTPESNIVREKETNQPRKDVNPFSGTGRTLSSSSSTHPDYSIVRDHWLNKFPTKRSQSCSDAPVKQSKVACPTCEKTFRSTDLNDHLDVCLKQSETTSCLACGHEINKSDLNNHLEDCLGMSNVFDTTNVEIEPQESDKLNCPFCLEVISEDLMQTHIDGCLNEEKKLLIHWLCDEDI